MDPPRPGQRAYELLGPMGQSETIRNDPIKPGHAIIFWGGFLGGGGSSTPDTGFLPIPILRDGRPSPAPIETLPRQFGMSSIISALSSFLSGRSLLPSRRYVSCRSINNSSQCFSAACFFLVALKEALGAAVTAVARCGTVTATSFLHRDWALIERAEDRSRRVYHRRRPDAANLLPWMF